MERGQHQPDRGRSSLQSLDLGVHLSEERPGLQWDDSSHLPSQHRRSDSRVCLFILKVMFCRAAGDSGRSVGPHDNKYFLPDRLSSLSEK